MTEDVSSRIMKKIKEGPQRQKLQDFLLWAIHEEFIHDSGRWIYKDAYDKKINSLCREDE